MHGGMAGGAAEASHDRPPPAVDSVSTMATRHARVISRREARHRETATRASTLCVANYDITALCDKQMRVELPL